MDLRNLVPPSLGWSSPVPFAVLVVGIIALVSLVIVTRLTGLRRHPFLTFLLHVYLFPTMLVLTVNRLPRQRYSDFGWVTASPSAFGVIFIALCLVSFALSRTSPLERVEHRIPRYLLVSLSLAAALGVTIILEVFGLGLSLAVGVGTGLDLASLPAGLTFGMMWPHHYVERGIPDWVAIPCGLTSTLVGWGALCWIVVEKRFRSVPADAVGGRSGVTR